MPTNIMKNGTTLTLANARAGGHGQLLRTTLFVLGTSAVSLLVLYQTWMGPVRAVGLLLLLVLLSLILFKDVERYRRELVTEMRYLVLIGVLLAGTLLIGRLFDFLLDGLARGVGVLDPGMAHYGFPLATGAMLAVLLIDVHTALTLAFIVSILAGFWVGEVTFSIFVFTASVAGAFRISRCKRRSAVIRAGLYSSGAGFVAAVAITLLEGQLGTAAGLSALAFSLLSGLAVATMISVLLPALEHVFHITTDISLLELLDLNQPLMRNLLLQAPGTYHHSIVVGSLAEAAAEAVGANPLLARVSAYYHDIGKMKMPDYFIENQQSMQNRHEKLSTSMSSLIIASHVKEGVELAREYKLPEEIVDIIRQHHGTSLMTYFYQKAQDRTAVGDAVDENDYRYPGPKPQSRVAALVMMADAVEAASRVLSDPTPARVQALVEKIINRVFLDGQLDECELTLKDLQEIKNDFSFILTGIFHRRIDYPGMKIDDTDTKPPAQGPGGPGVAPPADETVAQPLRVIRGGVQHPSDV